MSNNNIKRGDKFGKLIVYRLYKRSNYCSYWLCSCECSGWSRTTREDGSSIIIREDNLLSGHTRSCGCIKKEMYKQMKK